MRLLVLHSLTERSRQTNVDHVLAWARHLPNVDVSHLNLRGPVTPSLRRVEWDAVVVNYCYLGFRTTRGWPQIVERHRFLRDRAARVIAVPQDDYTNNVALDDWVRDFGADVVYSPIGRDLDVLYPTSHTEVPFRLALTGYVEDGREEWLRSLATAWDDRAIDVGQRVRDLPPHYGRMGSRKAEQARMMARALADTDLNVDISTRPEDVFVGDDWFRFLGNCRFTLGRRGGASLCDPDGSIRSSVERYRQKHPNSSFDEVEAACFPGQDGRGDFSAISPRVFDAAIMGTCQILTPDDYLGILEPWKHYVPLAEDGSNIDEVIDAISDDELAQTIAANAYEALIASGRFTYRAWVNDVVRRDVLPYSSHAPDTSPDLTVHEEEAGRLDLLVTAVPDSLAGVFRVIVYRAGIHGWLPGLRRLHTAIGALGDSAPSRLNNATTTDLLRLVPGVVTRGVRPAVVAETLRQVKLAGGHVAAGHWIAAQERGDLDTPHPSHLWRSAPTFQLVQALEGHLSRSPQG